MVAFQSLEIIDFFYDKFHDVSCRIRCTVKFLFPTESNSICVIITSVLILCQSHRCADLIYKKCYGRRLFPLYLTSPLKKPAQPVEYTRSQLA